MIEIIVKVTEGLLRGKLTMNYRNGQFYSFYGIPYATPPLASLRFKAPVPPKPWEGIRNAIQEKDGCIARHTFTQKVEGSEDCLYLNVYSSMLPPKEKPVMVWIHGGGFQAGSNKTDLYGPNYLLTEDIVLVTVSYRLGVLGFLCLEDASLGVTGNNSLRDIIMALKWVQRNITAFLGNSNNVTLFGQSTGAISSHYLMCSPLAEGLFHKIILQSGTALHQWGEGARDCAVKMTNMLGLPTSNEKDMLEFLQRQPADVLFKSQEKLKSATSLNKKSPFLPVIEKESPTESSVISERSATLIQKGKYNKMPMIIGCNSNEGLFFEYAVKRQTKVNPDGVLITNFEDMIPHNLNIPPDSTLSRSIAKEIREYYFNGEEPTIKNVERFYELCGDVCFTYLVYKTAQLHLENIGHPIYLYRFSVDGELNFYKKVFGSKYPGAAHADECFYLFKTSLVKEPIEGSLEEITIRRMVKLWTNFARHGDPNIREHNKKVEWKPIEKERLHYLNIGGTLSVGLNPYHDRFKFWDRIYGRSSFFSRSRL